MPIESKVYPQYKISVVRWSGTVEDVESIAAYRSLYTSDEFVPGFDEVTDLRGADMTKLGMDALQTVGAMVEQLVGVPFKTATLVDGDLPHGLARMYEALSAESPEAIRIFRDQSEAAVWIGCPTELLDRD